MKKHLILQILFYLTILCIFTGCREAANSQTEFALGTVCTITLYDKGTGKIYNDIFNRLRDIEQLMSVNIPGSDIDRINQAAGIEPVKVDVEVFNIIKRALYFADLSDGAFDLTVGPLVKLWDVGRESQKTEDIRIPGREEIDNVLPLVNWHDVLLDESNKTIFLKKPGQALDLDAIAKGYAADEAAAIIKKAGIPRAIIDLGGNILVTGSKKDKSPWKVGIQNPLDSRGAYIGIVQIPEKTVVTSGVYERFFFYENTRYHHIFLPSSGYPVRNGLLSVTIITDCSMDADALSTAVFVLGYQKGRELIESLTGFEGIFVFEDQSIRMTQGVNFLLTDTNYRIVQN